MQFLARAALLPVAFCLCATLPAVAQSVQQASLSAVPPPQPGSLNWLYAWSGAGVTNTAQGGYLGAVAPVNGNLNLDGIAFRWDFAATRYGYTNSAASPLPFVNTRIDTTSGSFMAGYRKSFGESWLSGYVGAAYETHSNGDPAATLRGTEGGAKALVEYFTPLSNRLEASALASFASPFTTYYADAKVGYKIVDKVLIGPESSVFGDIAYRESRFGGYIGFKTPTGQIDVAGGYLHPLSGNPDGYYVSVNFGVALNR